MPITLRRSVQPTLAILTEPQFAYGMEGLLQQRHREVLSRTERRGREKSWSPETDLLLASRYTRDTLEDKAEISASYKSQWGLRLTIKCRFLQW